MASNSSTDADIHSVDSDTLLGQLLSPPRSTAAVVSVDCCHRHGHILFVAVRKTNVEI
ncbi:hypothetical protein A2U01_0062152 [Trifolium medium]|uniref:Uncharacterized protein n=1 Tax=Trifolium medium TaxID=97028 RepID=A0A392RX15_9FABA|nr:hypothetical protein [Trifolium medium]